MMRALRIVAIAATCTVCMAGAAQAADANTNNNNTNTLGRLFFTPAQRAQLDAARAKPDRQQPETTATEQTAPSGPEVVTYSGVVRRSDGKSTVWINGKPITERSSDSDANISVLGVRRDGAVSVTVPQVGRTASLRVGQSMDVISGTIEEPYARRATRVNSPTPAKPVTSALQATLSAMPRLSTPRDTKESDSDSGTATPVERDAGNRK